MAGSLSDAYEKATVDWMLGGANPTRPATLYLALFTAAPGETGGGTEVSGNGYARQQITFAAASIGDGSTRVPSGQTGALSSNSPTYTAAGGDWGTLVAVAVYDAATGGNEVFYSTLDTQRQVKNGDTFAMPAGQVAYTQD